MEAINNFSKKYVSRSPGNPPAVDTGYYSLS